MSCFCLGHPVSQFDILGHPESHHLSQNNRMVGVGRDLCGSSSPIPLVILRHPKCRGQQLCSTVLTCGQMSHSVHSLMGMETSSFGFWWTRRASSIFICSSWIFHSLSGLKGIIKWTLVKSAQLPCIDVARVSYSTDLKRKQKKAWSFPHSPQTPGLCILFFLKSWKICLLSSRKDKLHVDFKLHFPISKLTLSLFLRAQCLLLPGRKDG